jgi:phage FluMu protein gp41
VILAVLTDGMNAEQRAEFERALREATGSGDTDAEAAKRRAYALSYGEM